MSIKDITRQIKEVAERQTDWAVDWDIEGGTGEAVAFATLASTPNTGMGVRAALNEILRQIL